MLDLCGLIGSLIFAIYAWPQAYVCVKKKSAKGINWSFIIIWFFSAFFSALYAILTHNYPLLPNFVSGGMGVAVILLVKINEHFTLKRGIK